MANNEPGTLTANNPVRKDADNKPHEVDPVAATISFPTHTKNELISMQRADPTIKEFLKFWGKDEKLTLAERKRFRLTNQCVTMLRQ